MATRAHKNLVPATRPEAEPGLLSQEEFHKLSEVPPEAEWFANIRNARTRRAYRIDVGEFMQFVGILRPEAYRIVTRAHVIAWRNALESKILVVGKSKSDRERLGEETYGRTLAGSIIQRKLSALSSLFEYLYENNAVTRSPAKDKVSGKTNNAAKLQPNLFGRRSVQISADS